LATFLTAIFLIEQELTPASNVASSSGPSRIRAVEWAGRREGGRSTGEARYPPRRAPVKAGRDRLPRVPARRQIPARRPRPVSGEAMNH
jgi:hypothetical protein